LLLKKKHIFTHLAAATRAVVMLGGAGVAINLQGSQPGVGQWLQRSESRSSQSRQSKGTAIWWFWHRGASNCMGFAHAASGLYFCKAAEKVLQVFYDRTWPKELSFRSWVFQQGRRQSAHVHEDQTARKVCGSWREEMANDLEGNDSGRHYQRTITVDGAATSHMVPYDLHLEDGLLSNIDLRSSTRKVSNTSLCFLWLYLRSVTYCCRSHIAPIRSSDTPASGRPAKTSFLPVAYYPSG
jgi:hypothetical protein